MPDTMTGRPTFISILMILFAVTVLPSARGQEPGKGFTLPAAPFTASTEWSNTQAAGIKGTAGLVITAVNDDDTLTGRIQFQFDEPARRQLAARTGTAVESIPGSFAIDSATLRLRKGTSCPEIRIEAIDLGFQAGTQKMRIDNLTFRLVETREPLTRLFCAWARQINADRHRLGIVKAINRMISDSGKG